MIILKLKFQKIAEFRWNNEKLFSINILYKCLHMKTLNYIYIYKYLYEIFFGCSKKCKYIDCFEDRLQDHVKISTNTQIF